MNSAKAFGLVRSAGSPEEALEALRAAGVEASLDEVRAKWGRARDEAVSVDELEAVTGGVDRDWLKDGCAATVESGSWCGSNDSCTWWDVTYANKPNGTCPVCNRQTHILPAGICIVCGEKVRPGVGVM